MKTSQDNHRTKKLTIDCIFLCFNIEDMKLVSLIFLVVHRYNLYPAHPCTYVYFLDLLTNSFMYQSQCVQCTLLLLENCTVNISFCTTFLFVKKKYSMGQGDMHFHAADPDSCQTGQHHKKLSNFGIRTYPVSLISDR